MKKNIIYISAVAFALLLSACERVEEIDAPVSGKMEEMKFFASIESGADTKTMIDGNVGDETRHLKWLPGDEIGVYNRSSGKFEKFVNVNAETSASGVFEGANTVQDVYYAVYPYSESHSYADRDKIMTVDLPAVQNYAENTFGNGANPMVAHAESGEELMFQNLCGVLVINLTGEVSVKSMTISLLDESGNLAPVSGKHTVSMDYIEEPSLNSTEESTRSVTLDCGDGVALNSAEPTSFHIVVPAGTYSGVTLNVVTADGQMMVKQGKNQLKIRRRRVTSAGALGWETVVAVDLSERGTSNCYIVSEPGAYSFDATVIGNGEFGLIPDAGFHTDDVNIAPSTVELLWEDVPGLVQSVYCVNGRAGFYCSGKEGNAVLAAKDASGTIIWSWHIWGTDNPVEQIYVNDNGTFTVMDRNIGATRADRGYDNEWEQSVGMLYQWGRKDPLYKYIYTAKKGMSTIEETIQSPDSHASLGSWSYNYHWEKNHNNYLWDSQQKTIYDPCPVGYMVADINAYYDLSVTEEFDKGYYASVSESSKSWFPVTPMIHCGGGYVEADSEIVIWSSGITASGSFRRLHIKNNNDDVNYWEGMDNAAMTSPVRCMKDEGYVDLSLPTVYVVALNDITESSVKIVADVRSEGVSEVTERGIIWGTDSELSDGVKVSCGNGSGQFSHNLVNLDSGTIYYVMAYAVNDNGESQSEISVFSTCYLESDAVDLSQYNTANTYIVSSPGLYIFNCLVKGNGTESVGNPVSAAVVWETKNTDTPVSAGEVVTAVELRGGYLSFEIPTPFTPGNALVAVKDVSGNILWSWHIWVADFDPNLTAQTYVGGTVMMDRNLGALRNTPGDPSVNGLYYQWGRKDPLLSAYNGNSLISSYPSDVKRYVNDQEANSIDYTIKNPSVVVSTLLNPEGTWAMSKTIYDPCPSGWRVPDGGPGVWAGIDGHVYDNGGYYLNPPYSEPSAYYPGTGYTGGTSTLYWFTSVYSYSCTSSDAKNAYSMCMFGAETHDTNRTVRKCDEHSVRCMKE